MYPTWTYLLRPEQMKFSMEEVLLMKDTLTHTEFVLGCPGFQLRCCALCIANWSDACQLSTIQFVGIGCFEGVVE